MSHSYPIWNKIQACIYKASKCYGVKSYGSNEVLIGTSRSNSHSFVRTRVTHKKHDDGSNEVLIGTSRSNSHSFVRTRVTHKKHEDGSRTYHFYIDDKLYKKATLKKKDNKPLIELVA